MGRGEQPQPGELADDYLKALKQHPKADRDVGRLPSRIERGPEGKGGGWLYYQIRIVLHLCFAMSLLP